MWTLIVFSTVETSQLLSIFILIFEIVNALCSVCVKIILFSVILCENERFADEVALNVDPKNC